jgi:hypothetical protein
MRLVGLVRVHCHPGNIAEYVIPYALACSAHLALTEFLQMRKLYVVSRREAILAWRDDS